MSRASCESSLLQKHRKKKNLIGKIGLFPHPHKHQDGTSATKLVAPLNNRWSSELLYYRKFILASGLNPSHVDSTNLHDLMSAKYTSGSGSMENATYSETSTRSAT